MPVCSADGLCALANGFHSVTVATEKDNRGGKRRTCRNKSKVFGEKGALANKLRFS